jgi:hypothetical protein
LLAQGWWFSPGTPASSTTKIGRNDIAEILLKVALKHQNQTKSINTDALPMETKLEIRMKQPKTPRERLALLLISTGHNTTI